MQINIELPLEDKSSEPLSNVIVLIICGGMFNLIQSKNTNNKSVRYNVVYSPPRDY